MPTYHAEGSQTLSRGINFWLCWFSLWSYVLCPCLDVLIITLCSFKSTDAVRCEFQNRLDNTRILLKFTNTIILLPFLGGRLVFIKINDTVIFTLHKSNQQSRLQARNQENDWDDTEYFEHLEKLYYQENDADQASWDAVTNDIKKTIPKELWSLGSMPQNNRIV